MAMHRLAHAEKKAGNLEKAEVTMDKMVEVFKKKQLKPHILKQITAETEVEKATLRQA
jgi:isopentenyl diphosphate isomerase/L-lactate dehydrogenase-like FMN-dependent dehydrogenase